MRIEILTLFPAICEAPLSESMMKRARESGKVEIRVHNLRNWAKDKHRTTDDMPFGGGQGMVMKAEPIFAAVEELQKTSNAQHPTSNTELQRPKVILMSPTGRKFNQKLASELSTESRLSLFAVTTRESIIASSSTLSMTRFRLAIMC